ncbi:MAG: PmoA family protein [Bacteroidales bacterium]|nr:PmoA family protein [Bacteroidales bacterium]
MKTHSITIIFLAVILSVSCSTQPKITFVKQETNKQIDIMVDGKIFTSYRWPDNVCKPILYPIFTVNGTEITRGFPIKPREGERADHQHQIGMWLTYGNVNGSDFWGNGSQGLGTKNSNGGVIRHLKIDKTVELPGEGVLATSAVWVDSTGKELLKEQTEYHFSAEGETRIIDRITTLTAGDKDVSMPDTKEGMFGIRVARQLELPSKEDVILTDAKGDPTTVKALSNEGVSGNYLSSEGITGEAVWGTRAKWMDLYGNIGDEKISLVICDHPKNQSYPTYWHARGYGLFSANPLGVKDFTQGKEELNFSIPAGKSTTFRYRVIVNSGSHLTEDEINAYADDFAKKY